MMSNTRLPMLLFAVTLASFSTEAMSSLSSSTAPEETNRIRTIGTNSDDSINVLIYETEDSHDAPVQYLMNQIEGRINGINVSVFGRGENFNGFGSKFLAVLPILRRMDNPNSLVVISDSRDVLMNNPYNDDSYANILADEFKMAFEELTYGFPDSIVISAEAQCCVSALTHSIPGSYFNADGSRKNHACSSGEIGCLWTGDEKALPWESFMQDLMLERTATNNKVYDDMYLNAGLIAGKVKDLIRVIEAAQIRNDEDDQAVFTDYMYHHPEEIVLDYEQKMFGNNRGGTHGTVEGRCAFTTHTGQSRLVHTKTNTSPLFVHSPGGFFACHDLLADSLGVPSVPKKVRNLLQQSRNKTCNYGKGGCNDGTDLTSLMDSIRGDKNNTATTSTTTIPATTTGSSLFDRLKKLRSSTAPTTAPTIAPTTAPTNAPTIARRLS